MLQQQPYKTLLVSNFYSKRLIINAKRYFFNSFHAKEINVWFRVKLT